MIKVRYVLAFTVGLVIAMKLQECGGLASSGEKTNIGRSDNDFTMAEYRGSTKKTAGSGNIMQRLLPLLVVPFLLSSAIIPGMLVCIKVLFVKSALVGKIAVMLMLLNFFRRRASGGGGGVYDHYAPELTKEHYGFQGIEEPGIYIHKRRK